MVLDLSDSNTFADPKAEENRSHVCGILSRFSSGQQSVFKKCRGKNKTILSGGGLDQTHRKAE